MRAFDQARDVGHHERAVEIDLHDAEVGDLRGERIVGDLRPGPRHAAQERALAGVGHAHEAHVGDHLEFEPQAPALALFAGREVARGLIGGRLEPRVSFAAFAAAGRHHAIARLREVLQQQVVLVVEDHRAGRDENDQIVGAGAVALGAAARLARLGPPMLAVHQRREAVDARLGDNDHAAAVAAVAAVGPATRNVLLAPEADATVAPFAGFDLDRDAVDEHGRV